MRYFITLPLLVEVTDAQTWSDPLRTYLIQDWNVDPATIHGFHAEAKGRYMEVYTVDGRFKVEMTRVQLLEALDIINVTE